MVQKFRAVLREKTVKTITTNIPDEYARDVDGPQYHAFLHSPQQQQQHTAVVSLSRLAFRAACVRSFFVCFFFPTPTFMERQTG